MKPSVLHLISSTQRRGAETFACQLSEELQRLGHRSEVAALVAATTKEPLEVEVLGPSRRHPRTLRELRRRARDADVVIAHGGATLEACAIGLAGSGSPFIYRVIGDPRYWIDTPAKRFVLARLHRRAAHHVVLAKMIVPYLVECIGIGPDRITVIPNGVPAQRFPRASVEDRLRARVRFSIAGDGPVAAFVGALSPEKNVGAALKLLLHHPELKLLVAGDGPERTLVEAAQRSLAGDRLRYLGTCTDIWSVYAAADVVVLPSRTEMMPAVAIEAAMVGTPVLACRVGALEEMVHDGLPAVLVASSRQRDLEEGMKQVMALIAEGVAVANSATGVFEMNRVMGAWRSLLEIYPFGHVE